MKIVIDSNRIIAALIKDGATRSLLFDKKFEFIAPSYIFSEIKKYKDYIVKKTNISGESFEALLSLAFENIKIIKNSEYNKFIKEIRNEISDFKDLSYLAVAILTKARGIWTHDIHFKKQNEVKVFSNMDLLKFIKEKD